MKSLVTSNCLVCLLSHQLHLIVKAQTMEYLRNLHEQLFQVTPEKCQKVTRSQDPKRLSEIERLKELLFKTDARLSEDGKSIKCLLCGKSPKLDKCKRSAEGHIKYFNRVHSCTTKTTNLETSQAKIKDFQRMTTSFPGPGNEVERMIDYLQS